MLADEVVDGGGHEVARAAATRERGASPRWRVEARITLWDHAAFEVTAQSARPHGAVDEVAHDAWIAMRARVRGDASHLGRVA